MTEDDLKRLTSDDRAFREHMIGAVARIEANGAADRKDIRDLECAVYGPDNKGGLLEAVTNLKKDASLWNKGLAIAQGLITIALLYLGFRK